MRTCGCTKAIGKLSHPVDGRRSITFDQGFVIVFVCFRCYVHESFLGVFADSPAFVVICVLFVVFVVLVVFLILCAWAV